MPQTVNEVMTADPRTVEPGDSLVGAAPLMREHESDPADTSSAAPAR